MKNHHATTPLHLNVSWSAKNISCPDCKSLAQDFPSGLNHMPIKFKIGEGGGIPYKIVDMHLTIEEILTLIKNKKEFKKYPNSKLDAVSPSNNAWIATLWSKL